MSTKDSSERLKAYRDAQRHPIFSTLQAAADGHVPTARELDALDLPDNVRRTVLDAARIAAGLRAEGEAPDAREHAHDVALRIIGRLPDDMRASGYLREPEPEITDPAELAAQVSRTSF